MDISDRIDGAHDAFQIGTDEINAVVAQHDERIARRTMRIHSVADTPDIRRGARKRKFGCCFAFGADERIPVFAQMIEPHAQHVPLSCAQIACRDMDDMPLTGGSHTHLLPRTQSFLRASPAAESAARNFSSQTAASAYLPPASRYSQTTP